MSAISSGITSSVLPSARVCKAMWAGPAGSRVSPLILSDMTLSLPLGTIVV